MMATINDIILKEFLNPNINVITLADKLQLSPCWLYEKSLRETGKSPQQLLEELRCLAARPLLLSGMTVLEISKCVGYDNTKTFSSAFKRRYGKTPRAWVKDNHGAQ